MQESAPVTVVFTLTFIHAGAAHLPSLVLGKLTLGDFGNTATTLFITGAGGGHFGAFGLFMNRTVFALVLFDIVI